MLVPPLTTLWSSHPGLAGMESLQKWKFLWCQICESAPWRWSILLHGWYRHLQLTWTHPVQQAALASRLFSRIFCWLQQQWRFIFKPTTSFLKQMTLSPFRAAILAVWCIRLGLPCAALAVMAVSSRKLWLMLASSVELSLSAFGPGQGYQMLVDNGSLICIYDNICVFHQIQDLGDVVFNLI